MGTKHGGRSVQRWQARWGIVGLWWGTRSASVVFYRMAPGRGADVPQAHFAKLHKDLVEVVLVCDRYSAYKALAKEYDAIVLAKCWAQVRRDFLNAARSWPELAPWMWKWIEDIRTLYRLNTARLAVWDATVPLAHPAPALVARHHDLTTQVGEMQVRWAMYRQEHYLHQVKRQILVASTITGAGSPSSWRVRKWRWTIPVRQGRCGPRSWAARTLMAPAVSGVHTSPQ